MSYLPQEPEWDDRKQAYSIRTSKHFRYEPNLNYLSRSENECLFRIESGKIYKAISIEGKTAVVEVAPDGDHGMLFRFADSEEPADPKLAAEFAVYIREWFDLERDMAPFYELAQRDELLRQVVPAFYGLRIMGIPDLFEALSWGIIGQQINLAFAYTLKRRFVEAFGRSLESGGVKYWLFPSAEVIAGLDVADLIELRMTTKKSEYLIGTASLIADGHLTKERLCSAGSCKQAEKILVDIRGIGPWTANYVMMRCLRMSEAFPIDDVGLHNALKRVLGMKEKPAREEILRLSGNWTGWEAYATFYLWRTLY